MGFNFKGCSNPDCICHHPGAVCPKFIRIETELGDPDAGSCYRCGWDLEDHPGGEWEPGDEL